VGSTRFYPSSPSAKNISLRACPKSHRLAGQLHDYIFRKLTSWDKERGQDKAKPDNSAIMGPIAHNLTEAQVKAVAAYLSYLE
jgi:cytochrome c553